ncbi:hypothetical protein GJ496_008078 [Pomphorhynchus laevis]|nr:hypothetical protein GJ496_008078 [Pomphorhynchus laevis]
MTDIEEYEKKYSYSEQQSITESYNGLRKHFLSKWTNSADENIELNEIITFNVSGTIFQIPQSTLANYANTLLADKELRQPFWQNIIIRFYRTGVIRRPKHVDMSQLFEELKFFRIDYKYVEQFLKDNGYDVSKFSDIFGDEDGVLSLRSSWFSKLNSSSISIAKQRSI